MNIKLHAIFLTLAFLMSSIYSNVLFAQESQLILTLEKNVSSVSLVLYYNPSCYHCKSVLAYLHRKNKTVTMKNTASSKNYRELKSLGQKGVPTLVVGTRIISGANSIIAFLEQNSELLD